MLAMLQSIPSMIESSESDGSESPPEPAANSVTKDEMQLAILQLLCEMQTDLKQSQSNNDRRFNPSSRKNVRVGKLPMIKESHHEMIHQNTAGHMELATMKGCL